MKLKHIAKEVFQSLGYEIRSTRRFGKNPFNDIKQLAIHTNCAESPVIFDVGANVGQSIGRFRRQFATPTIHSFEPDPHTFVQLEKNTAGVPHLHLNNFALGPQSGQQTFITNWLCDMSSFLEPDVDCFGSVKEKIKLEVQTLDGYCAQHGVEEIHVLKSDTQGYDLEVLRGADKMICEGRVYLVYMEIIFSHMYHDLPPLDEIYKHLTDRGFNLVTFYEFKYQNQQAGWTDALFVHSDFLNRHSTPAQNGVIRHTLNAPPVKTMTTEAV